MHARPPPADTGEEESLLLPERSVMLDSVPPVNPLSKCCGGARRLVGQRGCGRCLDSCAFGSIRTVDGGKPLEGNAPLTVGRVGIPMILSLPSPETFEALTGFTRPVPYLTPTSPDKRPRGILAPPLTGRIAEPGRGCWNSSVPCRGTQLFSIRNQRTEAA